MSKSFVLTHRYRPNSSITLGVDDRFPLILEILHIDVSELSQEELETFFGTLAVLYPEVNVRKGSSLNKYVLRYQ